MRYRLYFPIYFSLALALNACSGGPQLFWPTESSGDSRPAYAKGNPAAVPGEEVRVPLDVPPELRAELELPGADSVASNAGNDQVPPAYREAVTGKAVSLDAKVYDMSAMDVFSAVVDAMTSLNLPVDSVDSPSGIVTTDWVRHGANNPNILANLTGGGVPTLTRHRFVVRVFRLKGEVSAKSRLEIRLLSQSFQQNRWVNTSIKNKVSAELFDAVDEQLTRMHNDGPLQMQTAPKE